MKAVVKHESLSPSNAGISFYCMDLFRKLLSFRLLLFFGGSVLFLSLFRLYIIWDPRSL